MIIISVYGLPRKAFDLDPWEKRIKEAVGTLDGIDMDDVNVYFIGNMNGMPYGKKLVVKIEATPLDEENTAYRMGTAVGEVLGAFAAKNLKYFQRTDILVHELGRGSCVRRIHKQEDAQSD